MSNRAIHGLSLTALAALASLTLVTPAAAEPGAVPPEAAEAVAPAEQSGATSANATDAEANAALVAAAAAAAANGAAEYGDVFLDEEQALGEGADASSPSAEAAAKLQQLRRNDFFYQSYGKADPFKTLVQGRFEELEGSDLVDLNSARLVGVMWGQDDQFALVEDGNGFGYILRVGDAVLNGTVVSIRKNALTAKLTLYGITSAVTLKLDRSEG